MGLGNDEMGLILYKQFMGFDLCDFMDMVVYDFINIKKNVF